MKLLALILLTACGTPKPPMTLRPDTRRLEGVVLDSAVMRSTLQTFRAAYPSEAAMCYYGAVKDTLLEGKVQRFAWVERSIVAAQDSADEYHVWFPRGMISGCIAKGELIGIAHAHQHGGWPCEHSVPDAWVLMENRRALFSIVFCADGQLQVLYQDGRRVSDNWLRSVKS